MDLTEAMRHGQEFCRRAEAARNCWYRYNPDTGMIEREPIEPRNWRAECSPIAFQHGHDGREL